MYFLLLIDRDVALYALGIGACCQEAVDPDELKYVYNENGQEYIKVLHLQFVKCVEIYRGQSMLEIWGWDYHFQRAEGGGGDQPIDRDMEEVHYCDFWAFSNVKDE